nr:hypothetical protein [Tanacetum cinerariifolium]
MNPEQHQASPGRSPNEAAMVGCKNHGSPLTNMNTACDQVEFQRISLTGFRRCASRFETGASQSRQSTDCHKFDSWKNLTSHLPRACLMLALAGFPFSL